MGMKFAKDDDILAMKKDSAIFGLITKLSKNVGDYKALYIYASKLENKNSKSAQRTSLVEIFENAVKKSKSELFNLPNDDVVIIYDKDLDDEMSACLVKLRFIFNDEPLIRDAADLKEVGFISFFDLNIDVEKFQGFIKSIYDNYSMDKPGTRIERPQANYKRNIKRKELNASDLAKVKKILSVADCSSLIRRQSVCAVIGNAPPQPIFEEVYISIPDLRDTLLPDVDLMANPWLFFSLSETLDKRVLEIINRHDDGSLIGNFSININVSTILSDDFLVFDDNINDSMRSTIVLELQLVDIFSDIKSFLLAKNFAQARGYKVCIDGITVDKLKYLNREQLNCDLIKIIWHPDFMDVVNEDGHFTDYINKSERAKLILCRIDNVEAVEVGNSLGINLYQGRYIQRMLNEQPKKTIYNLRR